MSTQIYVALLDENVDVWRPVQAERQRDGVYRILDQPYDRETESWEFEPGDLVFCELRELSRGPALTAVSKVTPPS